MIKDTQKIVPFLWFDDQAEEAVRFYQSVFGVLEIGEIARYDEASATVSGKAAGSAMTVAFRLFGQRFVALNGGPHFQFTPAISFLVNCDSQEEVDRYWEQLSAVPEAEQCGWLVDKYGVSWQIVPTILFALLSHEDPHVATNVSQAMLAMKKIDIAALQQAGIPRDH